MKKVLTGLALSAALAVPAHAEMIATPAANPAAQREGVLSLVERPEVARELQKMGIAPDQARARVAAMSEQEVASLAGRLDSLPAGGELGNQDFLFIIVVLLLVALIL
ncbi:MAG TPA: PA2779 family protein [Burkholderiales bacterium]|nr:PA2779 family protein [Burkholderiales bacterium]